MFIPKILKTLLVFLLLVLYMFPASGVQAKEQEPTAVLLVYDSLAKGTSKEGNVESLQRLLASYGVKVTLTSLDNYRSGTLQPYKKAIGVYNKLDISVTNENYVEDFEQYQGDYLHIGAHIPAKVQSKLNLQTQIGVEELVRLAIGQFTQQSIQVQQVPYIRQTTGQTYGSLSSANLDKASPYAVKSDGYAYVPYFEKGNLSELALAYLLKDWLAVTRQSQNYVVIKEIYPFSDLKLLEQLADKLYEAGIPFLASVRPVFSNTDYPAMQRYLETLKYVQSRNGTVLVNAPVVASTISQLDRDLSVQIETFIDVLADYGIAPLGLGAEMYWSYDEHYAANGMNFFDSGILFPNERLMYKAQTDTSQPFSSSIYSLQSDIWQHYEYAGKVIKPLPMDTAITLDFFEDESQLDAAVQELSNSWVTFADYKYEEHTVHTTKNMISSRNGTLVINGQPIILNEKMKGISKEYAYTPEEQKSFEKLFNVQNKIFIVVILFTLIAFGIFFIVGYRLYKRKYYK